MWLEGYNYYFCTSNQNILWVDRMDDKSFLIELLSKQTLHQTHYNK